MAELLQLLVLKLRGPLQVTLCRPGLTWIWRLSDDQAQFRLTFDSDIGIRGPRPENFVIAFHFELS